MKYVASMFLCIAFFAGAFNTGLAVPGGKYDAMYDPSKVAKQCYKLPPVRADYTPKGTEFQLGDMTIYETPNYGSKKVLIDVYDIFGFTTNTKQVADLLAKRGSFRIVIPDFFRGSIFMADNWPPKDASQIGKFLGERGNWEKTVRNDVKRVMEHFKTKENVHDFGMFGFCWGGKVSVLAASELPELKAVAIVHPASVTSEEAEGVKRPMYLMPSKNEPDMLPFLTVLRRKFGDNCGHRRFDDQNHGFAGARGNFNDPANMQAVGEVINIIEGFFNRNFRF